MSLDAPAPQEESPSDILARLKYTMNQLPWGPFGPEVNLNPPDVMEPRVIIPKLVDMQAKWDSLRVQLTALSALLETCKSYGVPAPEFTTRALLSIESQILTLQGVDVYPIEPSANGAYGIAVQRVKNPTESSEVFETVWATPGAKPNTWDVQTEPTYPFYEFQQALSVLDGHPEWFQAHVQLNPSVFPGAKS